MFHHHQHIVISVTSILSFRISIILSFIITCGEAFQHHFQHHQQNAFQHLSQRHDIVFQHSDLRSWHAELAGGHAAPNRGNQPKGQVADPLSFVPGYKPSKPEPTGPARRNPDPFAFGAARPSVAQLEERLTEFSDQIYASREDPEQEFVHMHVRDELKKMIGHCKVHQIPPPVGTKEAISDLDKTVVGPAGFLPRSRCTVDNVASLSPGCFEPSM